MGVTSTKYKISPESHQCNICFNNCNNEIITPCNHSFCYVCLNKWIQTCKYNKYVYNRNTDPTCPVCRYGFDKHKLVIKHNWVGDIKYCYFK